MWSSKLCSAWPRGCLGDRKTFCASLWAAKTSDRGTQKIWRFPGFRSIGLPSFCAQTNRQRFCCVLSALRKWRRTKRVSKIPKACAFFEWCGNMVSERDGFHFHQVDPKYTSQDCSCCGQCSPKNFLWRYAPLTVSFVDTRLTETTTLHEICFIGQLLPFVESVGLPTSLKRKTLTKQKTLEALRTQSSYRCLTLGQAQIFRLG